MAKTLTLNVTRKDGSAAVVRTGDQVYVLNRGWGFLGSCLAPDGRAYVAINPGGGGRVESNEKLRQKRHDEPNQPPTFPVGDIFAS